MKPCNDPEIVRLSKASSAAQMRAAKLWNAYCIDGDPELGKAYRAAVDVYEAACSAVEKARNRYYRQRAARLEDHPSP